MADTKTSDETSAVALTGAELIRGVQSAANVKLLASQILAYSLANLHSVNNQTGTTYTYLSGDLGKLVSHSNAASIAGTLPQATGSFGAKWFMFVQNRGAGTLTITPTTSTIDGAATLVLTTGNGAFIVSDGTNYFTARATATGGGTPAGSSNYVQYNASGAFGAEAAFAYDPATNTLTVDKIVLANVLNEAPTVTIASAGTVNIGAAAANSIDISGTTTITAFDTIAAGAVRVLRFSGILTLTHNATSLALPSAASISTAAGDYAAFMSRGGGNWYCIWYQRASGLPLVSSGGSLTNFTEAINTSAPNATIPVASLIATNAATSVDVAIMPKGSGAITARVADNGTTNGNKRGSNAVDLQRDLNIDAAAVAAAPNSVISGGFGNKIAAAGTAGTISGGYTNHISAGSESVIGGGRANTISSNDGTISGGFTNTVSTSNYATVGGGNQNTASGTSATVPGGEKNTATANYSAAMGVYATSRALRGSLAHSSNGTIQLGERQWRRAVLDISTTDAATTKVLTSDGAAASTTNQFALPTGSTARISGIVAFRNSTSGDSGSFQIDGQAKNVGGTVSLSGTPVIGTYMGDASLNTVVVAIVADNTNKAIQITVNGVAATNIDFVASIESIEATA